MTEEQRKEFEAALTVLQNSAARMGSVQHYLESGRVSGTLLTELQKFWKAAHNAAVKRDAETVENSSHAYMLKNVLQNLIP